MSSRYGGYRSNRFPVPKSCARVIHQPPHLLDRIRQADKDCLPDQEMTDIEFADMGYSGDCAHILISEAVTGMDLQTQIGAKLGGVMDMLEELVAGIAAGIGIGAGMQLH